MIQSIGYNEAYNSYNRIQYPVRNEEALRNISSNGNEQNGSVADSKVRNTPSMDLKLDSIKARPNASMEDISLSLNQNQNFQMKGSASDLADLDIDRAVSDMQKDEALMQYQYFVGNESPMFESEDGMVVAKASM